MKNLLLKADYLKNPDINFIKSISSIEEVKDFYDYTEECMRKMIKFQFNLLFFSYYSCVLYLIIKNKCLTSFNQSFIYNFVGWPVFSAQLAEWPLLTP